MRRVPIRFLIVLFGMFVLMSWFSGMADITDSEAHLLWIVRDPESVEPAAVGDTARLVLKNFRVMLDRAEPRDLPLAAPLDVWTMLAGGSIFAARSAMALFTCLAATVAYRLGRRANVLLGAAAAIFIFLLFFVTSIDVWSVFSTSTQAAVIAPYRSERQPHEPVITVFRDNSALGYYQAEYDLRRGVEIDLGWRDFTDDEVARVIENLGSQPIWLIRDERIDLNSRVRKAIEATGRIVTWCRDTENMMLMRFEFSDSEAARCMWEEVYQYYKYL